MSLIQIIPSSKNPEATSFRTFAIEYNTAANIEQLRLQGENEQLEYKVRVPDKQDKFLKTVAVFANGSGGIILVGVADDGSVEGINEDVNKCMDAIVNKI